MATKQQHDTEYSISSSYFIALVIKIPRLESSADGGGYGRVIALCNNKECRVYLKPKEVEQRVFA